MREVSCAILAGGASSRFGRDKAIIEVGGETLIERVASRLGQVTDDLFIAGNNLSRFHHLGLRLVQDLVDGMASLGGIYTAMDAARHPHVFVAACDLPFLDLNLIRYMFLLSPGYDVVMPYVHGEAEPMHAIYGKACIPPIQELIRAGERKIITFLPQMRVREVREDEISIFDPEFRSFFNLNTPQDMDRMRAILSEVGE
jgi:molybdopterin-guanine dinucleotide biosynthesis protein A